MCQMVQFVTAAEFHLKILAVKALITRFGDWKDQEDSEKYKADGWAKEDNNQTSLTVEVADCLIFTISKHERTKSGVAMHVMTGWPKTIDLSTLSEICLWFCCAAEYFAIVLLLQYHYKKYPYCQKFHNCVELNLLLIAQLSTTLSPQSSIIIEDTSARKPRAYCRLGSPKEMSAGKKIFSVPGIQALFAFSIPGGCLNQHKKL